MLLVASGLLTLAMALVGPRSVWGLLGLVPLFAGLVWAGPVFQISGRVRPRGTSRWGGLQ